MAKAKTKGNENSVLIKKPTQSEKVVKYIKKFGSITSWEAYADLGITQLGARIWELTNREGYVFDKKVEKVKNRFGQPCSFVRYSIKEAPNGKQLKMKLRA